MDERSVQTVRLRNRQEGVVQYTEVLENASDVPDFELLRKSWGGKKA